jgi:hypothetical protein
MKDVIFNLRETAWRVNHNSGKPNGMQVGACPIKGRNWLPGNTEAGTSSVPASVLFKAENDTRYQETAGTVPSCLFQYF